jgi:hypothetical protein
MSRTQYFVVLHDYQWKIRAGGKHYGPFGAGTQREAIKAAIETAQAEGTKNPDGAQVLVQAQDHFRTEWTYGIDPYPPSG